MLWLRRSSAARQFRHGDKKLTHFFRNIFPTFLSFDNVRAGLANAMTL